MQKGWANPATERTFRRLTRYEGTRKVVLELLDGVTDDEAAGIILRRSNIVPENKRVDWTAVGRVCRRLTGL